MAWTLDEQAAVARAIRGRRTIHNFLSDPVPEGLLERGIELARWAPNYRLTEPWRFRRLGPRAVAEVVELNARLVAERKGAEAGAAKRKRWSTMPAWLTVSQLRDERPAVDRENYAAVCCAIQNLSLYLWAHGVGMKWGTGPATKVPELHTILGSDPQLERVVGLFWYGYPQEVPRQQRQGLDQIYGELE